MLMETSDETLASLARSGDEAAFVQLVTRHYDLVLRVAFRTLGRRSDAEDLTQEIFTGLPRKMRSFRGDARFTTWLFQITKNAAIDHIRRQSTLANATDGWGELERMNRASVAQQRDEMAWLPEGMSTLPLDLRETVALVLGEDMTHAHAAQALGISEGTVSWRMSEVRRTLRALAEEEEHVR